TIMTAMDGFYTAMSNLASSPEQPYFRSQAVQKTSALTSTISGIANEIQELRYEADRDIRASIDTVNNTLDRLASINRALQESYAAGQEQGDLLDKRDAALNELLTYIDAGVTFKASGEVNIFTQT